MTQSPYWLSALAGNALYLDLSARRHRYPPIATVLA